MRTKVTKSNDKSEKVPDEVAAVLNAFRSLVKDLRAADREAVRLYGLGSAQIYVLRCLAVGEPLSVNGLADKAFSDQSTISLIVSKLVARGLIVSERSESDARRVELTLSAKGRSVVRRLPLAFQENFVGSLQRLPEARVKLLARLLNELLNEMGIRDEHPPMLLLGERSRGGRKTTGVRKAPTVRRSADRARGRTSRRS
jgi:DNA-binding MarR family transcriptional regulator